MGKKLRALPSTVRSQRSCVASLVRRYAPKVRMHHAKGIIMPDGFEAKDMKELREKLEQVALPHVLLGMFMHPSAAEKEAGGRFSIAELKQH